MVSQNFNDKIVHVVDDEEDIVSTTSSALKQQGYLVHSFSDSKEAHEDIKVCSDKISMLLTDIRMPGYNGFELARLTNEVVPDVPVVLMTSFEINQSEFEKVFPSIKIAGFLQKPFNMQSLLELVERNETKPKGET